MSGPAYPPPAPCGRPKERRWSAAGLAALLCLLAGCAGFGDLPDMGRPSDAVMPETPAEWTTRWPHGGRQAELVDWWAGFGDPLLVQLQAGAQKASPTMASAASRLQQARAGLQALGSFPRPRIALQADRTRGKTDSDVPRATVTGALAQLSWEIDLFGTTALARAAASARSDSAELDWHEARTLVAVEVAQLYVNFRACEAQVVVSEAEVTAREEMHRLTALAVAEGFRPRAERALAQEHAAQGRSEHQALLRDCRQLLLLLAELSGEAAPILSEQLARCRACMPRAPALPVDAIPAQVMAQRPDVARSLAEVRLAAAEMALARAQRLPQIALLGQFGHSRQRQGSVITSGRAWSIGPVQVTLPLFDGARLQAAELAQQARLTESEQLLKARVRQAVREVESALSALQAGLAQMQEQQAAQAALAVALQDARTLLHEGAASRFDIEDTHQRVRQARLAQLDIQRQHLLQWLALYKALGGGWSAHAEAAKDS